MASELEQAIQEVLGHIDPELREPTQRNVDALLQAGVACYDDLLAALLDPHTGELRAHACWLLGRLDDPRALPALLATLRDPDAALRAEAASALGSLGDDSDPCLAALGSTMSGDPDTNVRMTAALALGAIGAPAAVDPLLAVLADRGQEPLVRGAAAEALTGPREPRAVPALIAALSDPAPAVRFWSAFALGELGDTAALPALHRLAASDDAIVPGWWSVSEEAKAAISSIVEAPTDPE